MIFLYWNDLKYLKASRRKIGNRIKVSDSDFSNLIYKFPIRPVPSDSNTYNISSRGNHLPDLMRQCFARQAPKTAVDELCKRAATAAAAITGHDWGVSDPPKLCSAVWLHVVQILSRILYTCYIFLHCCFFSWTIVDWWVAFNRRHAHDIWVSSIGVDQAFPLDWTYLHVFSVAGCHNLPKLFNTLSIAKEIYCTKKINQIRSFLGEHGYYLNIQRAVILYWMYPVMAKCHQLLISKLPSLEAHNAW